MNRNEANAIEMRRINLQLHKGKEHNMANLRLPHRMPFFV